MKLVHSPHSLKRSDRIALLYLVALLIPTILFSGCEAHTKKQKEEMEKVKEEQKEETEMMPQRREIQLNETVEFEFNADGLWHPAPFGAVQDQSFRVVGAGSSQFLSSSIEFRIGTLPQIISGQTDFVISHTGGFSFRVRTPKEGGYKGPVKVQLTRLS